MLSFWQYNMCCQKNLPGPVFHSCFMKNWFQTSLYWSRALTKETYISTLALTRTCLMTFKDDISKSKPSLQTQLAVANDLKLSVNETHLFNPESNIANKVHEFVPWSTCSYCLSYRSQSSALWSHTWVVDMVMVKPLSSDIYLEEWLSWLQPSSP